jgi:hypothetical protein
LSVHRSSTAGLKSVILSELPAASEADFKNAVELCFARNWIVERAGGVLEVTKVGRDVALHGRTKRNFRAPFQRLFD